MEIPVTGNGGVGAAADFKNVVTDSKGSVETNIGMVQRLIPDPPAFKYGSSQSVVAGAILGPLPRLPWGQTCYLGHQWYLRLLLVRSDYLGRYVEDRVTRRFAMKVTFAQNISINCILLVSCFGRKQRYLPT